MVLPALDQWLVNRMGWTGPGVPSSGDLRQWQLERLRELVEHAKTRSPFYARHFSKVEPESIQSFEDIASIPTIAPEQFREKPERLLCVSQDDISRVVTLVSSGTTGDPKRVFHTAEDIEATTDYFAWGMSNFLSPGETALVLMPGDRPGGVGRLLGEAVGRFGARVVAHGVLEDAEAAVDQCLRENVQCIVGPSAHVNSLACAWKRRGLPDDLIRSVLLCWDAVPDAVVRNVEDALGSRVHRHWGMIETGLGGAVECAPGSGMHVRETDVFLEIVHPETGHVLPDGEFGEMVVTTLLRRGMPLIRYRTGDMGRILPGNCQCNSPLRRLDAHIHRRKEGVELPEGRLTLRDLSEVLYALPGLADFAVEFAKGVLTVIACGHGNGLCEDVREAVHSIPAAAGAFQSKTITLNIVVRREMAPAIAGLGKRCIRMAQENRP